MYLSTLLIVLASYSYDKFEESQIEEVKVDLASKSLFCFVSDIFSPWSLGSLVSWPRQDREPW